MVRDKLYAALLAQLTALTTGKYSAAELPDGTVVNYSGVLKVASRGFVMWDEATVQPACYIVPVTEEGMYKRGLPTKWLLRAELYVYVKWVDTVSQGVTALARAMDAIDYVLSPLGPNGAESDNGYVNNLNGLAVYCALNGAAEISGGFLGNNQTIARMPVEIVVA